MNWYRFATTVIRWVRSWLWRSSVLLLCAPVFGQMGKDLCPISQATHTAVKITGSWQDAATWDNGVPTNGARVYIPCNHTVTNHATTADVLWIHCEGVLSVCDHCDTQINVHTLYVPEHGVVMLGSEDMPVEGHAVLEFVPGSSVGLTGPYLPGDWQKLSLGLVCHGMFMSCGREKTPWKEIDATAAVGAKHVTLRELVYQWEPGDQILIAGTDSIVGEDMTPATRYQSEFRTITAIDSRTMQFADGLKYRHYKWRADLPYHCANLTRNVVIRSRDPSAIDKRGHLMFMHEGVDMRYTAMIGLGRTDKSKPVTDPRKDANGVLVPGSDANPRARYAWHAHRVGVTKPPSRVTGCVVDGSPGWGFLCHDSHCDFDNCVAVRCFGFGFGTEEGQERGHFRNCLSALNKGEGDTIVSTDGDHGRPTLGDWGTDGSGFWLQGGTVEVSGCVSFDNSGRGFALFNERLNGDTFTSGQPLPPHLQYPIQHPVDFLDPLYTQTEWWQYRKPNAIDSDYVPQRVFDQNTAYGNKVGLQSWFLPLGTNLESRNAIPLEVRGSVTNFTTWGRGAMCHLEYTRQFSVDGLKVIGDGIFRPDWASVTRRLPGLRLRFPHMTIKRYDSSGMKQAIDNIGSAADQTTHVVERIN